MRTSSISRSPLLSLTLARVGSLASAALTLALVVLLPATARAEKLRELTMVVGARENQLLGYGVVTGLNGTGDDASAPLAMQSTLAMLRRLGVQVDQQQLRLRNIAAVMVTATMPPFAQPGTKLDITVSSVGNARSLEGGVVVQTVLKGADRKAYAVAQGSLTIGGFAVKGKSGSTVQSGTVTTGRVSQGALIERAIETKFVSDGKLRLALKRSSFTVASRIAKAIDESLGEGSASADDGGGVTVVIPAEFAKNPVDLIAQLEELEVKVERGARVVISERTQTIVAGGDVRLAPVAVVHGNLTIVVKEQPQVSQPGALAAGRTTTVPNSDVQISDDVSSMQYISGAASLADLASALGTLGLTARELISVLQALKTAGALEAELVVE
ncbi:MAG: flagellar basal body P-ring protein FlgI [Myxococcales bacterium]|nr:flagellar basal body P-ring protein FlgI [Myxococcales bacterium]